MFRPSRLADYGVVLLCHMANQSDRLFSTTDLAEGANLPLPTVSKILTLLTNDGLLVSHRGARCGYRLAREPEAITVAEIVRTLDGPVAMTICLEHGPGACDVEASCPSRRGWQKINDAVWNALEGVSLAEISEPDVLMLASTDFVAAHRKPA